MKITRDQYNQLKENYKNTYSLMSQQDQDTMKDKLDKIHKQLCFDACVNEWNTNGSTINCKDFLILCESVNIEVKESFSRWILSEIIEVGQHSYSCMSGRFNKRKDAELKVLCDELTNKLKMTVDKGFQQY